MTEGRTSNLDTILAGGLFSKDLVRAFRVQARRSGGETAAQERYPVIIEFNENYEDGVNTARRRFFERFVSIGWDLLNRCYEEYGYRIETPETAGDRVAQPFYFETTSADEVYLRNSLATKKYAFAILTQATLQRIALDNQQSSGGEAYRPRGEKRTVSSLKRAPLYRIWPDHPLDSQVYQSACTIKADAARLTFSTTGAGIVWAVADSGIYGRHPHFVTHDTLGLTAGMTHRDFTLPDVAAADDDSAARALEDKFGHGTHIAGIIAGETLFGAVDHGVGDIRVSSRAIDEDALAKDDAVGGGDSRMPTVIQETQRFESVTGIAPKTKLLSLKVLNDAGKGRASFLIAAIAYIRKLNTNSQENRIHGVNMSLGYIFDLDWYGAGQSPLCREVNSLVQAGVCVVAAAGNSGGGTVAVRSKSSTVAYICSIADPGNADRAITVGSTHREKPYQYGISFFSSKGPTLDGRMKPDLVAPGERIISCDAKQQAGATDGTAWFCEQSGTSQATAHVSGAAAALMSWRSEYRNNPDAVKSLFMDTATDLKRVPAFQGKGMIDLMRAFLQV
ncbi:S8 family peptidase [Asticcacaulis sp. AC466]|uniref:S8 family peptidase n=1 Tax=Asticcacaulis sp. AC466 TaxID=1282362 RepID=UPI00138AC768|nr:S8 family peptidase [Asticcacaulis sp. AC466]